MLNGNNNVCAVPTVNRVILDKNNVEKLIQKHKISSLDSTLHLGKIKQLQSF